MKKVLFAVIVLALALGAGVAQADAVFDNMPGNAFNAGSCWAVGGSDSWAGYAAVAQPFTVFGGDFTLNSVEIAAWMSDLGTRSLGVSVLEDDGGAPGDVLEALGLLTVSSGVAGFNSSTNPLLHDGATYWVAVYPGGSDTDAGWFFAATDAITTFSYNPGSGWATRQDWQSGYRVSGAPASVVPEPSSLLALLVGAGGISGVLLRRRN